MSSFNGGREVCMLEGSSMVFQRVKHGVELRNIWEHIVEIGRMAFRDGF